MDEQVEPSEDVCPRCHQPVGEAWMVCAWCGEPIAAPAQLPVGSTLASGRYHVLGVMGQGGFGITYEAGDVRLRRRVAIKELFPEGAVRHGSMVLAPPQARPAFAASRERFLREARVLARFTHPGIVRVFEVFEEHGTAYLVMERLSGLTLVDLLRARDRPFTEAEVLDVAARVAAALRPVHAAGVLHRDVNPANVMLTAHGRIVVIDFGLARDFAPDHTVGMTRVVTPGYAPLEQYRGEARFGPSTDVYGLAATCYRLATGKVPASAVDRDAGASLASVQSVNPAISKEVSDAIGDGLELDASHRPQDLDAFLARLGAGLPTGPSSILAGSPGTESLRGAEADDRYDPEPPPRTMADPERTVVVVDGQPPAPPIEPDATVVEGSAAIPVTGPSLTEAVAEPSVAGSSSAAPSARVGQQRPGRRKVTLPLAALLVILATATPVLGILLVVLVVIPALATWGDSLAHRLRADAGFAGGWAERHLSPGLLAPARFVRNACVSAMLALPVIGAATLVLLGWRLLSETSLPVGILDALLRLVGGASVAMVLLRARDDRTKLRTPLAIDELVSRAAPEGRTTERLVVAWLVMALLAAGALWLSPDTFPLW